MFNWTEWKRAPSTPVLFYVLVTDSEIIFPGVSRVVVLGDRGHWCTYIGTVPRGRLSAISRCLGYQPPKPTGFFFLLPHPAHQPFHFSASIIFSPAIASFGRETKWHDTTRHDTTRHSLNAPDSTDRNAQTTSSAWAEAGGLNSYLRLAIALMALLCTNTWAVWSGLVWPGLVLPMDVRPYQWEKLFRCEDRTRGCPNPRGEYPRDWYQCRDFSSLGRYINYYCILNLSSAATVLSYLLTLRFPVGPNRGERLTTCLCCILV